MASYATRKRGARQAAAAGRQLDRDIAAARAEGEAKRAAHVKAYAEARKAEQPVAPEVINALRPGDLVRGRGERYFDRVVRVNAKTVTVDTGLPWVGRIPRDRIVDVRGVDDGRRVER